MSLQDRDWYRKALKDAEERRRLTTWSRPAVQLPLPYFNRRQQLWRATRRALRSEWFNVAVFLAVVLAVVIWSAGVSQ